MPIMRISAAVNGVLVLALTTSVLGLTTAWSSAGWSSTASPTTATGDDGRGPRIAFSRFDQSIGGFALWTATSDGAHQRRLTRGQAYFPAWSPDRTHLLFDFPDEDGNEQIGRINADSSGFRQLTDLPGISEAADYSPDGKHIVFDRFVPRSDEPFYTSLFVMRANGSHPRPLFGARSTTFDVEPDYSPSGAGIVFTRIRLDPHTEQETYALFVARADGSRQRQVTPFRAGIEHPHWSPDGHWIIYNRDAGTSHPSNGIYLVRPNGQDLRRIFRSSENGLVGFKPDFAPNGKRIVFGCFVGSQQQDDLCTMDTSGRNVQRIIRTPFRFENYPIWN
jgi:Tol biopolymer transport system component